MTPYKLKSLHKGMDFIFCKFRATLSTDVWLSQVSCDA